MLTAIALLAAAAAGAGTPPAPEPAQRTLQQRFDAARTQAEAGQCKTAVPEFDALATQSSFKAGTLPGAMISVLKGICQIKAGDTAEGERAIHDGLPRLQKDSDAFRLEIAAALLALGDGAMARWDYAGARRFFEQAAAIPDGAPPTVLNLKLAQATAFDGGEAPLRYASAAIDHARQFPDITDKKMAEYRTIHARILLNQGRNSEAYAEFKEVLKLSGGLDLKVSLADIVMRGDLALAAQLNGDVDDARRYLAYTGAGRTPESAFGTALSMGLPICGTETGLRPEDFAVVDLAIGSDGRVFQTVPIYTRGSAETAASFAKAVSNWTWDPETIKKIPAFYLVTSRVEVRCTKAGQQVPGLTTPIGKRFQQWAQAQLSLPDTQDNSDLPRRLHAETEASDPLRRVAAQGLLPLVEPASALTNESLLVSALSDADKAQVPAEVRNYLTLTHALAQINAKAGSRHAIDPRTLIALLDTPAMSGDALAADTIRLVVALPISSAKAPVNAADLIQQVATDERLEQTHPLRQAAYLQLANIAAQHGDFARAQAYFEATGLTEEQCALLGLEPAKRKAGFTSNDFPAAAMQYRFEGWVRLEYDIQSDGRPAGIRSVAAYPPFIFSGPASRSAQAMLFESSYRPSGGASCSAQQQNIVYRLAR